MATAVLRFPNIQCGGETGQFRANAECIGWKGSGGEARIHAANSLRKAEWFEGRLRLLCELEGGGTELLALDGFASADFDSLWRYFEQTCGVYLKKHRPIAALSEADFDSAMRSIEDAADRVDEAASQTVQKKAKEADLMKRVESVRDGLDQAVSGDKQALSRVFAANGCERIGRLRLVVDTVQLEVYHTDTRWTHLLSKCATIEAVLKELGAFRQWRPPEDSSHSSLLRRAALVQELRRRQGDDVDEHQSQPRNPLVDEHQSQRQPSGYLKEDHPLSGARAPRPAPIVHQAEEQPYTQVVKQEEVVAEDTQEPQPNLEEDRGKRRQYEDEEVTDPNSVRASAPDDCKDGEPTEDHKRMRYTHANSILEGWVWKRSRYLKRWRRRWLVLLPDELLSFKYRGDTSATERISSGSVLRLYSADGEVQQARCFCIVVRQRNYYMVCDDETQKTAWMQEIESARRRG
eukprot:TRINITY_DN34882_c0_g1_i1.p1 TRINITY_DN34882_c0_g1~~TRINITY_DN34882_c0_g1_i1.p1  ORF type:complete len:470 (+),score=89.56 TRINITY_DN34882_c0_g1_i1:23-1411(+)